MRNKPKIVFISWASSCSRSDNIARELNGESYLVYYGFWGSNYFTIAFKYLFQTIKTLFILFRDRPDVVFVMNPSVVASAPVYVYCKLFGKLFIIDAHTGVLLKESKFSKIKFLQKYFSKHALLTIVTNEEIAKQLKSWSVKYIVVPDVPIKCHTARIPKLKGDINLTLVNTYSSDEPLPVFLEATKRLKNLHFYITGKINSKAGKYTSLYYDNVEFTDFLDDDDYYGLLLASTLVIVLTTREMTMQRGAYEAIYFGRSVVTSDRKVLRKNFPIGAVFVDNTVDSIVYGINKALLRIDSLSKEAQLLRDRKIDNWNKNKQYIMDAIMGIK